jgi:arabinofuranosyltransferase
MVPCGRPGQEEDPIRRPSVDQVALAVLVGLGLLHAASYAYVISDDAFISLRYARHLAAGLGLVYNPGEPPVEGFSNPLFTLGAAVLIRIGVPALLAAKALGVLGLAAALLLLPRLVRTLAPRCDGLSALAAPALLAFSAYPAFSAMTGLETMLHAGLVLVAVLASTCEVVRGRVGLGPVAWLAVACSRPEGAGLAVAAAAAQWVALGRDGRVVWRWALAFALPALLLVVGRYAYYGAVLPNTFHAKVGAEGFGKRGGIAYLGRFVLGGGGWVALPAVLGFAVGMARGAAGRLAVPVAVVVAQAVYVVLVGEDFMPAARFVMPVYPLLCAGAALLLALAPRRLPGRAAASARVLALVLACAGVALSQSVDLVRHPLRFWLVHEGRWPSYLARTDLRGTWLAGHQAVGEFLHAHAEPGDRLVVSEAGVIPFYASLPTVDLFGLTDREVASLWSRARGGAVADLAKGIGQEVFRDQPRWIVLDGQRELGGRLTIRLQIARWLTAHPDWKLYRPVFRAPVYTAEATGLGHDRIDVVFERIPRAGRAGD